MNWKPGSRLLAAELAKEWGTNAVQLWRWRQLKADPLPYEKAPLSRRVLFVWGDVEAWRQRNLEPKAVK